MEGRIPLSKARVRERQKGADSKNLDEMTLGELRALEIERYERYADQYDHAGPDAAKRVRYFEVVAMIYNELGAT